MLVLSRRTDEELVFPHLDIRVKVLRTVGNRVRLGIEAPDHIEILRGEHAAAEPPRADRHAVNNELNAVRLSLELYDRHMERGDVDAANRVFLRLVAQLRDADRKLAPPADAPPAPVTGPRVLVVDDDDNERELLAGLLQMDGCAVVTAEDGLAALELLHSTPQSAPDVVLLDMQMPRLGGRETLAAIRRHERLSRLLVFGVSGSTPDEQGIALGGRDGIDDWFEKPLNPNQLVARMKQRLAGDAVLPA
jgi:carbon storage regulator CsrA